MGHRDSEIDFVIKMRGVTPHIKSVFRNVPASNSDRGDGRLAPAAGSVSELKTLGNQGDDRRRSLPAILIGSRSGVNQPSFSCVVRVIIQHEHPRRCSGRNCHVSAQFRRMTVNPIDERFLGACQTALERVGRKLRFPDNFFQSQTEIHNFRTALAKVVPQLEKSDGIRKSCPAF